MKLVPKIEIILAAEIPAGFLTVEEIDAVARACSEHKVTHLKTPGGTFVPVQKWALVARKNVEVHAAIPAAAGASL